MKKILIAVTLGLSTLSFGLQAATEIGPDFMSSVTRISSISVNNGTIDELTLKIAQKAEHTGADYFRITSLNVDELGFATATLYQSANS